MGMNLVAFFEGPHPRVAFEDAQLRSLVIREIGAVRYQALRIGDQDDFLTRSPRGFDVEPLGATLAGGRGSGGALPPELDFEVFALQVVQFALLLVDAIDGYEVVPLVFNQVEGGAVGAKIVKKRALGLDDHLGAIRLMRRWRRLGTGSQGCGRFGRRVFRGTREAKAAVGPKVHLHIIRQLDPVSAAGAVALALRRRPRAGARGLRIRGQLDIHAGPDDRHGLGLALQVHDFDVGLGPDHVDAFLVVERTSRKERDVIISLERAPIIDEVDIS